MFKKMNVVFFTCHLICYGIVEEEITDHVKIAPKLKHIHTFPTQKEKQRQGDSASNSL